MFRFKYLWYRAPFSISRHKMRSYEYVYYIVLCSWSKCIHATNATARLTSVIKNKFFKWNCLFLNLWSKNILDFLDLRKFSFLSSYWRQKHTFRYLWLYTTISFIWISTIRFMFYFTCIDISKESVLSFELVTNLFCNLNPKNSP